jgi:small subunit ribosomal protein S15
LTKALKNCRSYELLCFINIKGDIFMLNTVAKKEIIKKFSRDEKDTGSPEVQIALITKRIETLTDHFKVHKKDFGSRRGLLILVGQRRRLLDYLMRNNLEKYREIIKELGIRK